MTGQGGVAARLDAAKDSSNVTKVDECMLKVDEVEM
jgi:hypothetical protein